MLGHASAANAVVVVVLATIAVDLAMQTRVSWGLRRAAGRWPLAGTMCRRLVVIYARGCAIGRSVGCDELSQCVLGHVHARDEHIRCCRS
jgi:hypothetical protein